MDKLKELPDNSIDSIVTDPPYELGFMGKSWDSTGIAYNVELWSECLRVLKPGGHLLSFGGTRTYHRMACAIEDAGFEIRDQIQWIYSQGFPKSHNISKAIDKKLGAEREVIGKRVHPTLKNEPKVKSNAYHVETLDSNKNMESWDITAPATELSKQYDGWGTALKPANEPIVLARKPLNEKTVVDNIIEWGTGGINVDGSRVRRQENDRFEYGVTGNQTATTGESGIFGHYDATSYQPHNEGRFPANIIFNEEAGEELNKQHKDASKFFYCAKATKKEKGEFNTHTTVKPIKLMEYLVKMITPIDGVVLDPFAGSGTTLVAARISGFNYIGVEMEEEYVDIANQRISELKVVNF